jgi:WD40 repeat protein
MLKKYIVFVLMLIFSANAAFSNAQTPNEKPKISLKYTLTDFRNPSNLRNRYGLLQFSPDGKRLAVSGTDRDIVFYDVETGKAVSNIESKKVALGGKLGFNAFSFSADGKFAVAQEESYSDFGIFDTSGGELVRKIDGRGKSASAKRQFLALMSKDTGGLEMSPVTIDANWKNLLVSKNDGLFQIVDFATGEVRHTLEHSSKSNAAWDFVKLWFQAYTSIPVAFLLSNGRFSPDGQKLVISNGDKSPTLWNAESGKLIAKLEPQTDRVYLTMFSPNGSFIATSDVDGTTKIWNAADGNLISSFGSEKNKTFAAAWNPDGTTLLTVSPKADARIWSAQTGEALFDFKGSQAAVVSLSQDKKLLATIHRDDKRQTAQIWNAETGEAVAKLPREKGEDRAYSVVWSPDGKIIVTASNNFVKVWSAGGELLRTLENAVFPARFNPDGKLLATGGKNDTGYVWQIGEN